MKVSALSGPLRVGLALMALLFLCLPSRARGESELRLEVGGARIEVVLMSGSLQLSNAELLEWVRNAAESVATYYGRFPVPRLVIRVAPFEGRGVRGENVPDRRWLDFDSRGSGNNARRPRRRLDDDA